MADAPPPVQPQADAMEGVVDPNLLPIQPQADAMGGSSAPMSPYQYPVGDVESFKTSGPIEPASRPNKKAKQQSGSGGVGTPTNNQNTFGNPGSTSQDFTFSAMPLPEQTPYMLQYAEAQALHDKDLRQALKQALKEKEQAFRDRDAWKTDCLRAQVIAKESQNEGTEARGQLAECDKARIAFANALEILKKERAKLVQERDNAKSQLANLKENKSEEMAWSTLQDFTELMDDQRQISGMKDTQIMAVLKQTRQRIEDLEKTVQEYREHTQKMDRIHAAELEDVRAKFKGELTHVKRQAQAHLIDKLTGQKHDIEVEHTRQMTVKNLQLRVLEERLAKQAGKQSTDGVQMTDAQKKHLEERIRIYEEQIRVLEERLAEQAREQSTDVTRQQSTHDQQQKMEVESDDEDQEAMNRDLQTVAKYTRLWSEKENLRQLNQHLLSEIQNHKNENQKLKQDCFSEVQKYKAKFERSNKQHRDLYTTFGDMRTKGQIILNDVRKLKPENEQLRSEVEKLKNDNGQLSIQIQQLAQNGANVQEAEGMEVDNDIDSPGMKELNELRSEHENLVSQHEGLISQHGGLVSQHDGLVSQHNGLLLQHEGLLSEKQKLENYVQEREESIKSLQKVAQEKDDLEKSLISLKNIEQEKIHLEQWLRNFEQEKLNLENLLEKVSQEKDDLEKSLIPLKNIEQEKINLEQWLRKFEQEKVDLEESLKSRKDIEQQKNDLEVWLKKAEKERTDLKLKNKDLWASKETTESEIQSLRKELDECRAEQKVLKQNCSIHEAKKVEVIKALDEAEVASRAAQESLNVQLEKSKESLHKVREKNKSLESGRQRLEKESKESLERAQREKDRVSADYQAFKEQSTRDLEKQREYFEKREVVHKEASDGELRQLHAVMWTLKSDMTRMSKKGEAGINLFERLRKLTQEDSSLQANQNSLQPEQNTMRERLDTSGKRKTESLADTVTDSTRSSLTLRDESSSAMFGESLPPSSTSDGSQPDQEADSEPLSESEEDSTALGKAATQQYYFRRGPTQFRSATWTRFFGKVLQMPESEVQKLRDQVFRPGLDHDRKRLIVASAIVGRKLEDLELALFAPKAPREGKFSFSRKPAALTGRFKSGTPRTEIRTWGSSDLTIQPQAETHDTMAGARDSATQSGEDVVKMVYRDGETQTMHMTETGDITTLQLSSAQSEKERNEDLTEVALGDPDQSSSHGLVSIMMPDGSTKKPRWIQTFQKPLFIFMLAIFIMLLAWVGCYGESARRERNLWLAANDLTRKAVISLRAGGGTGTGVPAWLWNDPLLDTSGQIYEDL
ncbi:MAG: hypothetical protein LQ342_000185 [Letrouitia transgressa]|nr:MAG: hypothetical protein LQ342_000185 [Letrouitia transgressa]